MSSKSKPAAENVVKNTLKKGFVPKRKPVKRTLSPNVPEKESPAPKVPKGKPAPGASTILIDSSGKPASNHPLANVISLFLAQNKGHTGDLLITDGTPNGAKYLIRQNRSTGKTSGADDMTHMEGPESSDTPSEYFISPQTIAPSKTATKTPKATGQMKSPEKSAGPKIKVIDVRSTDPTSTTNITTSTTAAGTTAIASKSVLKVNQGRIDPTSSSIVPQANLNPMTVPGPFGPSDILTVFVPVTNPASSNITGSQNFPGTAVTQSVLLPMSSTVQPNLPTIQPGSIPSPAVRPNDPSPLTLFIPLALGGQLQTGGGHLMPLQAISMDPTSGGGQQMNFQPQIADPKSKGATYSRKENAQNQSAQFSSGLAVNNKNTYSKNADQFTIVQKTSEASTENGTTTNKATFVIRGNGPLSPEQLEAIVRDNLLKNGTIKDGAKILIRHKGNPASQGPDTVKNGTFLVKESKIVPLTAETNTTKTTMKKVASVPSSAGNSKAVPQLPKPAIPKPTIPKPVIPALHPLFRYPKGMTPDKVLELRKTVKRLQLKLYRQTKVIERLKLAKKEQIKNLPVLDLARLVKEAIPGFSGKFFEAQLMTSVMDKGKHGHRWDDDTKVFALGLWNRSPAAFKLMQRAFKLPSIKTLTNWVSNIPPEVDFFEKLRKVLEKAVPEVDNEMEELLALEDPTLENEQSDFGNDNKGNGDEDSFPDEEESAAVEQIVENHSTTEDQAISDDQTIAEDRAQNTDQLGVEEQLAIEQQLIAEDQVAIEEQMTVEDQIDTIQDDTILTDEHSLLEKALQETGLHIVEKIVDSGDLLCENLVILADDTPAEIVIGALG